MDEATKILHGKLIRLGKGMISAYEEWLEAQSNPAVVKKTTKKKKPATIRKQER